MSCSAARHAGDASMPPSPCAGERAPSAPRVCGWSASIACRCRPPCNSASSPSWPLQRKAAGEGSDDEGEGDAEEDEGEQKGGKSGAEAKDRIGPGAMLRWASAPAS